jgi:hypothetical protein
VGITISWVSADDERKFWFVNLSQRIYCNSSDGASFGESRVLHVADDWNNNTNSSSSLGDLGSRARKFSLEKCGSREKKLESSPFPSKQCRSTWVWRFEFI